MGVVRPWVEAPVGLTGGRSWRGWRLARPASEIRTVRTYVEYIVGSGSGVIRHKTTRFAFVGVERRAAEFGTIIMGNESLAIYGQSGSQTLGLITSVKLRVSGISLWWDVPLCYVLYARCPICIVMFLDE